MAVGVKVCPSCRHENTGDAMFCSQCGTRVTEVPVMSTPGVRPSAEDPKATVHGSHGDLTAPAKAPSRPAERAPAGGPRASRPPAAGGADPKATLFGTAEELSAAGLPPHREAAAAASTDSARSAEGRPQAAAPRDPAPAGPTSGGEPEAPDLKATMFGLDAATREALARAAAEAGALEGGGTLPDAKPDAASSPRQPDPAVGSPSGRRDRVGAATMMGVSLSELGADPRSGGQTSTPSRHRTTGRSEAEAVARSSTSTPGRRTAATRAAGTDGPLVGSSPGAAAPPAGSPAGGPPAAAPAGTGSAPGPGPGRVAPSPVATSGSFPAFTGPESPDSRSARMEARRKRRLGPTGRTMIGQPAPRPSWPPPEAVPAPGPWPASAPTVDEAPAPPARRGAGRWLVVGLLGAGALAVVAAVVVAALSLVLGGSSVHARVIQEEDGQQVEIEVRGAVDGTRVRFGGEERPLHAGRARFPLQPGSLQIGANEVAVDVVAPDGSVESESVQLHVEFRVRADLGPLVGDPPALDIVVEAPPGSRATLDGTPLDLDERGRGVRRVPLDEGDASADGTVEYVVHYRVEPPDGETAQGELRTRVPQTTMQIDRPGPETVTDRDRIEVAGAVLPGATVTIDGLEAVVREGRFVHERALPTLGDHTIRVVARAPRRAPRVVELSVRRVEDLQAEADRFATEELPYGRLTQNPTTYRGHPVEYRGLAFNVVVRDGRSVVQMVVDDCPRDQQCPLWVVASGATTIERNQRVRVLGTVAGVQEFQTQNGATRTVPRIDATFLLPLR